MLKGDTFHFEMYTENHLFYKKINVLDLYTIARCILCHTHINQKVISSETTL